ncbi:hypothetical protein TcasGA2_TC010966 [Tribolium castaneum]|uniref:Uncharacterized protein n=1 Tax=Tribolium castaneum TaxID=7070 RepID=D6X1H5_TRICA|nr:hypothetical protein TcasGA2_TC010966 [Tribolium castaneum]
MVVMMQNAKTKEKSRLVLRDGSHRFGPSACAQPPSDGGPSLIPCRENQVCRGPNSATRSSKSAVTDRSKRAAKSNKSLKRDEFSTLFPGDFSGRLWTSWGWCAAKNKRNLVVDSLAALELSRCNSRELLSRYITVDETWIHNYTPETKEQSNRLRRKQIHRS